MSDVRRADEQDCELSNIIANEVSKKNNLKKRSNEMMSSSSPDGVSKENKRPKLSGIINPFTQNDDVVVIEEYDQSARNDNFIDLSQEDDVAVAVDVVEKVKKAEENNHRGVGNKEDVATKEIRERFSFSEDSQIVFKKDNNYIFANVLSVNEETNKADVEFNEKDEIIKMELSFYQIKDPYSIFVVGRKIDILHNDEWKKMTIEKAIEVNSKIVSFDVIKSDVSIKDIELKNVRMSAQDADILKNEDIVLCDFRESRNEAYDNNYNNPGKYYFVGKVEKINYDENKCDIRYFDEPNPTIEPDVSLKRLIKTRFALKVGENFEILIGSKWKNYAIKKDVEVKSNYLRVGTDKIKFENIRISKAFFSAKRRKKISLSGENDFLAEDVFEDITSDEEVKTYKCEDCGYATDYNHHFALHKGMHNESKPFSCDVCNFFFAETMSKVKNHKAHSCKPYRCDFGLCKFSAVTAIELEAHKSAHETEERPYACDKCSFAAVKEIGLTRHKKIHRKRNTKVGKNSSKRKKKDKDLIDEDEVGWASCSSEEEEKSYFDNLSKEEQDKINKQVLPFLTENFQFDYASGARKELESRVVEVKKSNIEGAGKGLFAKDDLYQHQIIALYANNNKLTTEKAKEQIRACRECRINMIDCAQHNRDMDIKGTGFTVRGSKFDTGGYINHCSNPININVEMIVVFVGSKEPTVVMYTTKAVEKGMELFMNYGGDLGDAIDKRNKEKE